MDHENTVKAYSASPSMLGRGHSLVEPQGPVWVRWLATKVHLCILNTAEIFYRRVYMPRIFILSWPLALQMGLARQQMR